MKFFLVPLVSFFIFLSADFVDVVPTSNLMTDDEKMQMVASRVFNDLKRAKGIYPHEKPHIKVRKFRGNERLAIMYLDSGEVHLDRLVYKICRNMGADSLDALAFMLSHELGHYINKHGGVNHNIQQFEDATRRDASLDNVIELESLRIVVDSIIQEHEEASDEAEADFEGGFIGYLAGYDPTEPGINLLKRVYDGSHNLIDLADTIRGYPTFSERLEIVEKTAENLAPMKHMFEMANYMAALEQYEDATTYYLEILKNFQSREIYNNIGVMSLLESMRCFNDKDSLTLFDFPITLDVQSRIDGSKGTAQKSYEPQFAINLVNKAIDNFSKALNYDAEYPIAHLNLAVSHTLMGLFLVHPDFDILDENKSKEYLVNAESSCYHALHIIEGSINAAGVNSDMGKQLRDEFQKVKSDVYVQLGIIKSCQKDTAQAIKSFAMAKKVNETSLLACKNMGVVTSCICNCTEPEGSLNETTSNRCNEFTQLTIDGNRDQLFGFYRKIRGNKKWNWTKTVTRGKDIADPSFSIKQKMAYFSDPDYNLYYSRTNLKPKDSIISELSIIMVPTSDKLESDCSKISGGDSDSLVYAKYGAPSKILEVGDGQLLVYNPEIGAEARDNTSGTSVKLVGSEERDGIIFHIAIDRKTQKRKVKKWVPFYTYKGQTTPIMEI